MSKLIVLAETNILEYLKNHDIQPAEFYTDFNMFKNMSSSFDDSIVVCIFAGTCSFSKRHVLETCGNLAKRADDDNDDGIKSLYILSDTYLPSCKHYYLYRDNLNDFTRFVGWKAKEKSIELWDSLGYDKSDSTKVFLSDYDKEITSKIEKRLENKYSELDELISLIKIPKLV